MRKIYYLCTSKRISHSVKGPFQGIGVMIHEV